MQYTVFDQLKQRLIKGKENTADKGSSVEALSALSAFVLGAISKSAATVITYPAIRWVAYHLQLCFQFFVDPIFQIEICCIVHTGVR